VRDWRWSVHCSGSWIVAVLWWWVSGSWVKDAPCRIGAGACGNSMVVGH
jgi:hypothetical protein